MNDVRQRHQMRAPQFQRQDVRAQASYPTTPLVNAGRAMGSLLGNVGGGVRGMFHRGSGYYQAIYANSRINYGKLAGDPMNNSAYAAVVNWVARNAPDAPLAMQRVHPDQSIDLIGPSQTSPGRLLRLWEKPNSYWSGPLMMRATVVDYYTAGDAYILKRRNPAGQVIELWWCPEWMMEPWWEGDDFITAFRQTVDGREYYWKPEDVIHFQMGIDPMNPRKGLSPARSLMREVFTDNEASAFTATLLKNLGVPGVIISPSNTAGPVRVDAETVKVAFRDSFGGDSRGEPMVMKSATDMKVLSFNPQQMELRDLRKIPEERISAVLGVAAIVAGLGAGLDRSTFSNFGEARRAAYTESIITLHRDMAAALELQLAEPDFPDINETGDSFIDLFFDWKKATAMQEAAGDVHKRAMEAATKGLIMRSDYKRETGRAVAPGGLDDVYIIANNYLLLPAGADADAANEIIAPEPPAPVAPKLPARQNAATAGDSVDDTEAIEA